MSLWRGQHHCRSVRSFLTACLVLGSVTSWGRLGLAAFTGSASPLAAAGQTHAAVEHSLPALSSAPSVQRLLGLRQGRFDLHPVLPAGNSASQSTTTYHGASSSAGLLPPPVPLHPPGSRGPPYHWILAFS
jgi:hypothetical protein